MQAKSSDLVARDRQCYDAQSSLLELIEWNVYTYRSSMCEQLLK